MKNADQVRFWFFSIQSLKRFELNSNIFYCNCTIRFYFVNEKCNIWYFNTDMPLT